MYAKIKNAGLAVKVPDMMDEMDYRQFGEMAYFLATAPKINRWLVQRGAIVIKTEDGRTITGVSGDYITMDYDGYISRIPRHNFESRNIRTK